MSDGKPEQVKMSHVHALDRRISDHRLEVNKSLNDTLVKLITPINELTSEIKLSNKGQDHIKDDVFKLSEKIDKNTDKTADVDKRLTRVETTQGGILGVSGKVFPVFMSIIGSAMVLLLSVSIYLKISP